jgi:hypothetical protein
VILDTGKGNPNLATRVEVEETYVYPLPLNELIDTKYEAVARLGESGFYIARNFLSHSSQSSVENAQADPKEFGLVLPNSYG